MQSHFLSLNWSDFGKGLIMFVGSAVGTFLLELIKNKGMMLDEKDLYQVAEVAVVAMLTYLLKNTFTNNEGKFGKADRNVVR